MFPAAVPPGPPARFPADVDVALDASLASLATLPEATPAPQQPETQENQGRTRDFNLQDDVFWRIWRKAISFGRDTWTCHRLSRSSTSSAARVTMVCASCEEKPNLTTAFQEAVERLVTVHITERWVDMSNGGGWRGMERERERDRRSLCR